MSIENLYEYERKAYSVAEISKLVDISEVPDDILGKVSNVMVEIKNEIEGIYSRELLKRSESWHAFAGSGMKETEKLPEDVEKGVAQVITDLLDRKLKPLLR